MLLAAFVVTGCYLIIYLYHAVINDTVYMPIACCTGMYSVSVM